VVRIQVQFEESQLWSLRQLSSETGRTISDLIREGIGLFLSARKSVSKEEQIQRALRAAGKFSSGAHDASAGHDRYLAKAFRE